MGRILFFFGGSLLLGTIAVLTVSLNVQRWSLAEPGSRHGRPHDGAAAGRKRR